MKLSNNSCHVNGFFLPSSLYLLVFLSSCYHTHAADVDAKRSLKAEDVLNLTWALAPDVSPDGTHLLYSVLEKKDGRRVYTKWLSKTSKGATPQQVLTEFKGVRSLRWSPNGKLLAFLAIDKNAGNGRQLFVSNSDTTKARRITAMPSGIGNYRWSSDSTTLAFTADERPRQSTNIVVVGSVVPRMAVWTIDTGIDAKPRRITPEDHHVIDFAWSPSGEQFAVSMARSSLNKVASPPASLKIVRRSDGTTIRVIARNATGGCRIAWSPDGKTIVAPIFARRKLSRRLALFPAAGGKPIFPFAAYSATPMSRVEWTADSRYLYVPFMDKTRSRLVRLEVETGQIDQVSNELTNFWDYGMNRDGTVLAFNAESQHDPPDIFVKQDGKVRRITDFNPHLKEFQLGEVKTVHWKSSLDGRTIYGVVITPPNFKAGKPCPTVVNLHSGPHWLWWEGWVGTYLSWGQYLASNGYVVFMPNHRGSIGQGWEFAEAHYLEWGRGDYRDVMDGVDWLVQQGIADPNRLGIGGGSFGGYLTAWTITQTPRFKAAVIDAGWTDLVTSNLTIDVPGPLRFYMNGSVLERTDFYRSRSPLTFVKKCRTPTLIMHGKNDRRAPTDQGRMFYRALKISGVETQMVIYQNEGHGLRKRENQLDSMRRVKNWFDTHLNRKPAPKQTAPSRR